MRRMVIALALSAGPALAAGAPSLTVTRVTPLASGAVRIGVAWRGVATPRLRVTPVCPEGDAANHALGARIVRDRRRRRATVEIRDDLAWLTDRRTAPCLTTGLAVELLDGEHVIARAPVPVVLPPPYPPPPLPAEPSAPAAGVGVAKERVAAPNAETSAAGLHWRLGSHVALGLTYERTTLGRPLPRDVGNGIRTSLRLGF
jgi:hypothetical protein